MAFPILGALGFVGDFIGGIFGSKKERDQQKHDRALAATGLDQATLQQFAAEFTGDRSLWGSLVDGLNRLPRPVMALGTLWIVFVWPAVDIEGFIKYGRAVATVPEGFWFLAGTVIAFYFGGRMQIKSQAFRQTEAQAATAARLLAEAETEPMDEREYRRAVEDTDAPMNLPAIEEWNRRRLAPG